jgi:hypothetical protein
MAKSFSKLLVFGLFVSILVLTAPSVYAGNRHHSSHTQVFIDANNYHQGYQYGINEWNQFASDASHQFDCPLAQTAPHSPFCQGYDAALQFENSDQ